MSILIPSVIGVALIVAFVAWERVLARASRRVDPPRQKLWHYPSVSVIRPVRGADVGARENFEAALDTGYPGDVETLFVFDDESDPGLPIAREVVRAHARSGKPGRAVVLVAGAPPPARTGKLNAMIVGAARAHGSLIAFGDSDTRPDRELLRELVETLMTSRRAGSAFAPVVIDDAPRAAGDVLYALMQNALYAPLAARAAARDDGALPFIMGQIMVFKREALDAIGGVQCATGQLVDDMYLGRQVAAVGYRNILVKRGLKVPTGGLDLAAFLPVYRRWMAFSRNGLPISFTWPQWLLGGGFFVALATAVVAGLSSAPLGMIAPALAVGVFTATLLRLNRLYGGASVPLVYAWTPAALLLLSPFVLASTLLNKRVGWRGRTYDVDASAALAVGHG
ncbi:MAG TPA: glycosyltransferase [Polyangia bacterium]|nr:glycosyltransferase [Polyangia bacterium]